MHVTNLYEQNYPTAVQDCTGKFKYTSVQNYKGRIP